MSRERSVREVFRRRKADEIRPFLEDDGRGRIPPPTVHDPQTFSVEPRVELHLELALLRWRRRLRARVGRHLARPPRRRLECKVGNVGRHLDVDCLPGCFGVDRRRLSRLGVRVAVVYLGEADAAFLGGLERTHCRASLPRSFHPNSTAQSTLAPPVALAAVRGKLVRLRVRLELVGPAEEDEQVGVENNDDEEDDRSRNESTGWGSRGREEGEEHRVMVSEGGQFEQRRSAPDSQDVAEELGTIPSQVAEPSIEPVAVDLPRDPGKDKREHPDGREEPEVVLLQHPRRRRERMEEDAVRRHGERDGCEVLAPEGRDEHEREEVAEPAAWACKAKEA